MNWFFLKRNNVVKFKLNIVILCFIVGTLYSQDLFFNELLTCNLSHRDVATLCNVDHELNLYENALHDESNYIGCPSLEDWKDTEYNYPSIHPLHKIIVDIIKELDISSVCEIGAGCGKVSKYVYAQNPNCEITCVEHNTVHYEQMKENFQTRTAVIMPDVQVKATLVKDSLPRLSSLQSNKYGLVFTCTVMMHLPFIIAVKSAIDIVRISNKYVLHVENKNEGNAWYNMVVVKPSLMSSINYTGIDYVKLYEKLGLKTIKHFEYKDPWTPATYVVYLGEKTL